MCIGHLRLAVQHPHLHFGRLLDQARSLQFYRLCLRSLRPSRLRSQARGRQAIHHRHHHLSRLCDRARSRLASHQHHRTQLLYQLSIRHHHHLLCRLLSQARNQQAIHQSHHQLNRRCLPSRQFQLSRVAIHHHLLF